MDLNAIRQSLTDQGIPFAFKTVENGTNLFFRINDQELAKNGLKRVIKEIGKQPINYQKKPKEVTFDEKVVQAKQKIQLQGERSTSINKVKGIQR